MPRDDARKPSRSGRTAVSDKPRRVPSEVAELAEAATRHTPPRREKQVKERIVARLKRLHPMD